MATWLGINYKGAIRIHSSIPPKGQYAKQMQSGACNANIRIVHQCSAFPVMPLTRVLHWMCFPKWMSLPNLPQDVLICGKGNPQTRSLASGSPVCGKSLVHAHVQPGAT